MADTSKLSVPISTARRISVIAEESDSGVQDVELSPQEIKEFFQAVELGSIKDLDDLFHNKPTANPNMTQFTESLLMAAIRQSRTEVAEYLVERCAINLQYNSELREFRMKSKIPIRFRRVSCRDLAAQKEMIDLVDMIDVSSDDLKMSSKRFIKRRLEHRLEQIHRSYNRVPRRKIRNRRIKQDSSSSDSEEERTKPVVKTTTQIHRPFDSRIEQVLKTIPDVFKSELSIEQTQKKTFRFSNYKIRFRLEPIKQQNQTTRTNFSTPKNKTQSSAYFPVRQTKTSIYRSKTTLEKIPPIK